MEVFDLNPEALEATASVVELYCVKQRETMTDYLSNISALNTEWDDDQTMGMLLEEIRQMKQAVETLMDEIQSVYPDFFRAKAEQIRNRPKF